VKAAIYTRISDDETGEALGVSRQEADCRDLADRLGWEVVGVYSDNDVSASRYSRKQRPAWRRMLADVEAGTIDAVVCWDQDRLVRRPLELEHLFATCDRAGVRHLATVSGETDLSTADGMFKARILGAVAAKESDNLSRRVRRKHAELAARGRWQGGPVPYGYRRGGPAGIEVDDDEAEEIRWAIEHVLGGGSVRSIAARWSSTMPPRRASTWSITAIRKVLTSDRIAGLRVHNGETYDALWDAIVSEATLYEVRATLAARETGGRPTRQYDYLLSGLVYCGRCGGRMPAGAMRRLPRYWCRRDRGGCGSGIDARRTDDVVAELLADYLDRLRASSDDYRQRATEDLGSLRAQLEQLARDHYGDGLIGRDEFLAARTLLVDRIDALQIEAEKGSRRDVLSGSGVWYELTPLLKQRTARRLLGRVVIAEASPDVHGYDVGRVSLVWTDE
jgi:DNA invertase Pin-like site-specific DNA recombinase